jgi:putative zinc transporter 7
MNNMDELFPKFQKSIENLIEDEEGNIPGKKLLVLGTMIVVLGSLMQMEVFAGHRSHSSHKSHSSHSSGTSGHGNHGSHESHASHTSHSDHGSHSNTHSSHASHTSHSNTSSHSNSTYSSEGDVTYKAPAAENVPTINTPVVTATADTFKLPDVNQNIELPNGTPASSIMPSLEVPASSEVTKIDVGEIHQPSATDKIE